jgi:hypothetical protein
MTPARQPRIGLLPFYLKLYDDLLPDCRAGFEGSSSAWRAGSSSAASLS